MLRNGWSYAVAIRGAVPLKATTAGLTPSVAYGETFPLLLLQPSAAGSLPVPAVTAGVLALVVSTC